jgi:hypothetical protein
LVAASPAQHEPLRIRGSRGGNLGRNLSSTLRCEVAVTPLVHAEGSEARRCKALNLEAKRILLPASPRVFAELSESHHHIESNILIHISNADVRLVTRLAAANRMPRSLLRGDRCAREQCCAWRCWGLPRLWS